MPWMLLFGFAVGGAMIAGLGAMGFRRRKPETGKTALVLKAAALPPLLIAILVAAVSIYALIDGHGQTGERSPGAAIYIATILGTVYAIPAFVGGVVGALVVAIASRNGAS